MNGAENGSGPLKIAIIGQSNFAADVLEILLENFHEIVGIFTIPDKGSREDILATTAKSRNIPVFKFPAWRKKGVALPDVLEKYKSVGANLNVLPFCSQFIPMEVINFAKYGSICYHPSILPRHRGASSISWTLIEGDEVAGFSIFWADDGLDTGPILLQKQCQVESTDTLDILYKRFLYPEGVKSMAEAVDRISNGTASKIPQTDIGATYDPALFREENQYINLNQTAKRIFDFIRGLDSVPGALATVQDGETFTPIRLFGAVLSDLKTVSGTPIQFKGLNKQAYVNEEGIFIVGTDDKYVCIKNVKKGNKMIPASAWFEQNSSNLVPIELTEKDYEIENILKKIWNAILKVEIESNTDFFACGAGSMDVVRLVEEVKEALEIPLQNENVFMAPVFSEFFLDVIKIVKQGSSIGNSKICYEGVTLNVNKRVISVPTQLFINGQFEDAENKKTLDIINPTTEEIICKVAAASKIDVDRAVKAAHKAFKGPWSQISAR